MCHGSTHQPISLAAVRAPGLASEHPGYVAAAFLGHSTAVANKHYWQVTDEDFERAIQGSSKATQNTTQHLHVSARKALPLRMRNPRFCRSMHPSARTCLAA